MYEEDKKHVKFKYYQLNFYTIILKKGYGEFEWPVIIFGSFFH
jgi:hypothetical protein